MGAAGYGELASVRTVAIVDFGEEMAGRSGGMVREAVWKAGKRVERLLDVCFGAWVKGDKTSGVAAGR